MARYAGLGAVFVDRDNARLRTGKSVEANVDLSQSGSSPQRSPAIQVLVYSHDSTVRNGFASALHGAISPDGRPFEIHQVATGPVASEFLLTNNFQLAILDGDATPSGGFGIAKQARDENHACPPIIIASRRSQDAWLAKWSGAAATCRYPTNQLDLFELACTVTSAQ